MNKETPYEESDFSEMSLEDLKTSVSDDNSILTFQSTLHPVSAEDSFLQAAIELGATEEQANKILNSLKDSVKQSFNEQLKEEFTDKRQGLPLLFGGDE